MARGKEEIKNEMAPKTPEQGKVLSGDAAKLIGLLSSGIQGVSTFKDALQKGNADFWSTSMFGGFTNPAANMAFKKAAEALGRMNSGGAITEDELRNFNSLIADKKMLTTEQGRQAIAQELSNLENRFKATGNAVYGGSGWMQSFGVADNQQSKQPRASEQPIGATRVINGKTFEKTARGWVAQ